MDWNSDDDTSIAVSSWDDVFDSPIVEFERSIALTDGRYGIENAYLNDVLHCPDHSIGNDYPSEQVNCVQRVEKFHGHVFSSD